MSKKLQGSSHRLKAVGFRLLQSEGFYIEELWADWIAQDNPYSINDRKSIKAGACQYLTFLAAALRCKQ